MKSVASFLKKDCVFFRLFYAHPLIVGFGFFFVLFILKIFIIRNFLDGSIYFRQWHTDNEGEAFLAVMAAFIAVTIQNHGEEKTQEAYYRKVWWFLLLYVFALTIFGGVLIKDVLWGEKTIAGFIQTPSEWIHAFFLFPSAFALLIGSMPVLWKYRRDTSAKYALGAFLGYLGLLVIDNIPALTPRGFVGP